MGVGGFTTSRLALKGLPMEAPKGDSTRQKAHLIGIRPTKMTISTIIKDEESIVFRAIDPGRLTTLQPTAPCPRVYG